MPAGDTGNGSGGSDVNAPVAAPVTVCGNGVGALGGASASCSVPGSAGGGNPITPGGPTKGNPTNPGGPSTPGNPTQGNPSTPGGPTIHNGQSTTSQALASTGVASGWLTTLAALLVLGGLMVLVAGRRRQQV
jgi:LPXTG-motif cell wall-anchored protein